MDKIIIYNPPNGSKIEGFVFENLGKLATHDVGELKRYDPAPGKALLSNFVFLEEKTPQEAVEIQKKIDNPEIKCEFCEFTFDNKVALEGHTKTHQKELEPEIDLSSIPVAEATPVAPNKSADERRQDDLTAGPEFYGPGLTETRSPRPTINQ